MGRIIKREIVKISRTVKSCFHSANSPDMRSVSFFIVVIAVCGQRPVILVVVMNYDLHPVVKVQLGQDVADVGLHRGLADKQLLGYLFVGIALAQQHHDFMLPFADAVVTQTGRHGIILLFLFVFPGQGNVHIQKPQHAVQQVQDVQRFFLTVTGNVEPVFQIIGNGAVIIGKAADFRKGCKLVVKIDRRVQAGDAERTYMDKRFPFHHGIPVVEKIFLTACGMFFFNGEAEQ